MEEGRLEIAGLESRSGLITSDFHRWQGHEGRRAWQGQVNVGSSAFHEGWGAGKTDPPGVEKSMLIFDMNSPDGEGVRLLTRTRNTLEEIRETLKIGRDSHAVKAVKKGIRDSKAGRVRPYREFTRELAETKTVLLSPKGARVVKLKGLWKGLHVNKQDIAKAKSSLFKNATE